MSGFARLFSPGNIGTMRLPNRFVMPPMATNYADENGCVTDRQIAYYRERARGGAGYITFEHTAVLQQGKAAVRMAMISSDEHVPGFKRLADAIHQEGGRLVIQINHGGRATASAFTGMPLAAPSAIACPTRTEVPEAMSPEAIRDLIRAYTAAALRVKAAGADGIEVHMAHGYLLNQFLSPFSNQRTDEFGGSPEKRLGVPLEALRAVRQAVGAQFPVLCRISADEYVPGGLTLADSQKIARALEANGADAIHVSAAVPASGYMPQPPYYLPEGVFAHLAAGIKSVVKVPVIAVGRIRTAALAETLLEEGKADFIAFGRALIADPRLPAKVRVGSDSEIIPCISCNRCIQSFREGNMQCAVNPRTGRELQGDEVPAAKAKKIWVIGGGPAGMKAAEVAARRGHDVTLFDKGAQLGGRFLLAAIPPKKAVLRDFVDYLERQVRKQPIALTLESAVDAAVFSKGQPDTVVLATGAEPYLPSIEGIQNVRTFSPDEALAPGAVLPANLVVLGGGGIGAEIADYFAEQGKQVTLIEMREGIALDMPPHMQHFLRVRLQERGATLLTRAKAIRFERGTLVVETPEGSRTLTGFGAVVVAAGSRPNTELLQAAKQAVKEVHVIGDAGDPRELMHALVDAEEVGRKI
ncbi:MAG TPA: FAD-dependent oxidoreductase [Candidatus Baltobacteraceae bacterium]|nr:FAD-dependent oxidoreductase [Candidatus Baltobacteraceae bacterium]